MEIFTFSELKVEFHGNCIPGKERKRVAQKLPTVSDVSVCAVIRRFVFEYRYFTQDSLKYFQMILRQFEFGAPGP